MPLNTPACAISSMGTAAESAAQEQDSNDGCALNTSSRNAIAAYGSLGSFAGSWMQSAIADNSILFCGMTLQVGN